MKQVLTPQTAGAAKRSSGVDPLTHPQQPFILGICEALGADAPLRRVLFLLVLWEAGERGISSGELERKVDARIGAAQSTTSRTVRLLARAGLVESYLCPLDRRSCLIRLTGVARVMLRSLANQAAAGGKQRTRSTRSPSDTPVADKVVAKEGTSFRIKQSASDRPVLQRSKRVA